MDSKFEQALVPGQYYHIYNRGINGENIFVEECNYEYFLRLYQKHVSPIVNTYAYCLLRNHFHFLVRIKDERNLPGFENLEGFNFQLHRPYANFFNAYAKGFNKTYNRHGSLFEKNFKRVLITNQTHLTYLVLYIHQNPQKHGLVNDFRAWPYSSYSYFPEEISSILETEAVISWFGDFDQLLAAHQTIIDFDDLDDYNKNLPG